MVGGAVRDKVMGIEPKDIDYVVVGATPADMLKLGYQQVGADFPVFLHPVTGDEYALARQERKTGVGYNGFDTVFDPSITLEDDLIRRDLTINAMAMDLDTGEIIDPYGGVHDIAQGVLRHTSEAFAEDPVRVLRTARFAARYGFKVADDTIALMRKVVPEIDHVPAERVFAEFQKGLAEDHPHEMIKVLQQCDADRSARVHPYLRAWLIRSLTSTRTRRCTFDLLWCQVRSPTRITRIARSRRTWLVCQKRFMRTSTTWLVSTAFLPRRPSS
jgi:tRNA nucleotidyltransferase (CCA-adding enzyme)